MVLAFIANVLRVSSRRSLFHMIIIVIIFRVMRAVATKNGFFAPIFVRFVRFIASEWVMEIPGRIGNSSWSIGWGMACDVSSCEIEVGLLLLLGAIWLIFPRIARSNADHTNSVHIDISYFDVKQ